MSAPSHRIERRSRTPRSSMIEFCAKLIYNNPTFSDYTIVFSGRRVHVHRVLLAPSSEYFRALFTRSWAENNDSTIELQDDDPDAVEAMIKWLYGFSAEEIGLSMSVRRNDPLEPQDPIDIAEGLLALIAAYQVGDKYDVPTLCTHVLREFSRYTCASRRFRGHGFIMTSVELREVRRTEILGMMARPDTLAALARAMFSNTRAYDEMRGMFADVVFYNLGQISRQADRILEELLTEIPDLAVAIALRAAEDRERLV